MSKFVSKKYTCAHCNKEGMTGESFTFNDSFILCWPCYVKLSAKEADNIGKKLRNSE